jgi:branched-chain amino acid transport system ATP-binding protein
LSSDIPGPTTVPSPAEPFFPAPAGDPLLALSNVSVSFGGVTALSEVSLEVAANVVFGVIGPNGAGKTTLFNVVCGFVSPTQGQVRWRGRLLREHRPHQLAQLGIGRTLQGLGLFDNLTVRENVMVGTDHADRGRFVTALLGLPGGTRRERRIGTAADAVLSDLDLTSVAGRTPASLPYGIRKRVALARALISNPSLLLLDEPASGLSSSEMKELGDIIRGLRGQCSVMLVEHHMDLVMSVTDEIAVLDFGRLIARGIPEEIKNDEAVIAAYLGEYVDETDAGGVA